MVRLPQCLHAGRSIALATGKHTKTAPEGAGIESQVPLNDRPHALTEPNGRCSSVCSVSDSKFRENSEAASRRLCGGALDEGHLLAGYLVGFAPPITYPLPDGGASLNLGFSDIFFIACSRAVPLLAVCSALFCRAKEFRAASGNFNF